MERNLKLTISYDGTNYHGYQRQQNGITIQQVLEDCLAKLFGHELRLTGAARTDAGVHAMGQVVNFTTSGRIPVEKIVRAANGALPDDIVVTKAEEVSADFHARFSAKGKTYLYKIINKPVPNPLYRSFAWYIERPLDVQLMHASAQVLVGRHDFSAFRASNGANVSPVKEIYSIVFREDNPFMEFRIHGSGFLYHMVRNIVGTLIDIGLKKTSKQKISEILASRDRKQAGITAPAHGLYLEEVYY